MRGTDAFENVQAYYESFLTGARARRSHGSSQKDGSIRVKASGEPTAVKLWQASNPKARDFRVETIGRVWKDTAIQPAETGEWVAQVAKPDSGLDRVLCRVDIPREREVPAEVHDRRSRDSGHLAVSAISSRSASACRLVHRRAARTVRKPDQNRARMFLLGGGGSSPVDGSQQLRRTSILAQ